MTRPPDSRSAPEVAAVLADLVEDLAFLDDLTGVFNRRLLSVLFTERWSDLVSASPELGLVMVDLDFFKEVNDTHGHLVGDRVLQLAAEALRNSFRAGDLVIRYGGDEFVILLPGARGLEVEALVERARVALERQVPAELGPEIEISFSVGTARLPADASDPDQLLEIADVRLYADKEARRRDPAPAIPLPFLVAGIALLLGVVAAGLFFRGPAPRLEVESVPAAPGDLAAAGLAPDAAGTARGEEAAEVRRRMRDLEEQVEALRAALERERSLSQVPVEAADDRREQEIATLVATIEELRERLEEVAPGAPESETSGPAAGRPSDVSAATTASAPESPGVTEAPTADPTGPPEAPVVVAPRLVAMDPPVYPPIALRSRREATLLLRVLVGSDGEVVEAEPIQGEIGLGFGDAAVRAALDAIYEPGTRNGEAVPMPARLEVRFRLD